MENSKLKKGIKRGGSKNRAIKADEDHDDDDNACASVHAKTNVPMKKNSFP